VGVGVDADAGAEEDAGVGEEAHEARKIRASEERMDHRP
jgi:hypothetical protein